MGARQGLPVYLLFLSGDQYRRRPSNGLYVETLCRQHTCWATKKRMMIAHIWIWIQRIREPAIICARRPLDLDVYILLFSHSNWFSLYSKLKLLFPLSVAAYSKFLCGLNYHIQNWIKMIILDLTRSKRITDTWQSRELCTCLEEVVGWVVCCIGRFYTCILQQRNGL